MTHWSKAAITLATLRKLLTLNGLPYVCGFYAVFLDFLPMR
jgi:hypothetical protein